jgi:hypothetical protein
VRIISIARALPIAFVSLCVPPAPGITPKFISGCPNFADSEPILSYRSSLQARILRQERIRSLQQLLVFLLFLFYPSVAKLIAELHFNCSGISHFFYVCACSKSSGIACKIL